MQIDAVLYDDQTEKPRLDGHRRYARDEGIEEADVSGRIDAGRGLAKPSRYGLKLPTGTVPSCVRRSARVSRP